MPHVRNVVLGSVTPNRDRTAMTATVNDPYTSMASFIPDDGNVWIPWDGASGAEIKVVKLNPSTDQMIVFIKLPPGGTLTKHFHPGIVIVYTLQGRWTYGEGWTAEAGDSVFETAGSTHAPTALGDEDTVIFAVIEGTLEFVDEDGTRVAYENWQTLLRKYHDHCRALGVEPREVTTF